MFVCDSLLQLHKAEQSEERVKTAKSGAEAVEEAADKATACPDISVNLDNKPPLSAKEKKERAERKEKVAISRFMKQWKEYERKKAKKLAREARKAKKRGSTRL